jgi:hypothetical protein
VRALAAHPAVYLHLPYDEMALRGRDLLGIDVSVGALSQMVAEADRALELFTEVIHGSAWKLYLRDVASSGSSDR